MGQPANILLVDDRPENLVVLEEILRPMGHTLTKARSGDEALRHLLHEDFAVILLDVQMPGLDGFETATHIKQREKSRHIPIIFLTAINREPDQAMRGYSAGAVDYLAKPFEVAELVARVRVHADHTATETVRRWLTVGAISLDLDRRTATINGRRVDLSQREFLLLSHLMRRAGQVCRREELLAEVWGYNTPSNVLDVYVRRLRTKLDPSQIETVRHVGYSFTE